MCLGEDCSGRGNRITKLGLGTVLGGFGEWQEGQCGWSALAEENVGVRVGGTEPTSQQRRVGMG